MSCFRYINICLVVILVIHKITSTILDNVSDNFSVPQSNVVPQPNTGLLMDKLQIKRYPRNVSRIGDTLQRLKHAFAKILPHKDNKKSHKRESDSLSGVNTKKLKRNNSRKKFEDNQKWDNWTKWSSCSVTCGKGREIRWRHCTENCNDIEMEMEEKMCQLPACPQKLFGIINL